MAEDRNTLYKVVKLKPGALDALVRKGFKGIKLTGDHSICFVHASPHEAAALAAWCTETGHVLHQRIAEWRQVIPQVINNKKEGQHE